MVNPMEGILARNKTGHEMNESLVKYLAGLLDADGSMSFKFRLGRNTGDRVYVHMMLSLASSDAVDVAGFVDQLPAITGMGVVSKYGDRQQFKRWDVSARSDLEMLLPRLIKHMVIKARHWQWMLEQWRQLRAVLLAPSEREALAAAVKESRIKNVGPLKPKNHPTWAWLAGYLDGDGCYRNQYLKNRECRSLQVNAVAHENDASVLRFLQQSFGGSIRAHGAHRTQVQIWTRGLGDSQRSFALGFLSNVTKHSRLKKHKIDQMIHYHQQRLSDPAPAGEATV